MLFDDQECHGTASDFAEIQLTRDQSKLPTVILILTLAWSAKVMEASYSGEFCWDVYGAIFYIRGNRFRSTWWSYTYKIQTISVVNYSRLTLTLTWCQSVQLLHLICYLSFLANIWYVKAHFCEGLFGGRRSTYAQGNTVLFDACCVTAVWCMSTESPWTSFHLYMII